MVLKSTFAPLEPGAGAFSIMIFTRASAMLTGCHTVNIRTSYRYVLRRWLCRMRSLGGVQCFSRSVPPQRSDLTRMTPHTLLSCEQGKLQGRMLY
jgi:hypothetical protein